MLNSKKIRYLGEMWKTHTIGTFVITPKLREIGAVVGWMGMFTLVILPDGTIKMCKNESCRPVSPPVDPYNRSMVPKTLVYIMEGRYKGTYGRIAGSIHGKVFLKPEPNTLCTFLQVAGPYERHVFIVNCGDVHII